MTRTIWLASYPKSGNTWMRMLIANASIPVAEPVDINKAWDVGLASDRKTFDYIALVDSGLMTHDEVDCLRPRVYMELARGDVDRKQASADKSRVQFIKVHDAYTLNSVGEPLLGGARSADGAIIILRDPRDVAPSLAHHLNRSIDEAIAFMNDVDAAFHVKTNRQDVQLRQKVHGWSEHAGSWLDQTDIPVHLIRYEDLLRDTARILRRALEFSGLAVTKEDVERAVVFSDFKQLRQQEQKNGFAEAPRWDGANFFRRGEAGNWREELTREQVARIEARHGCMMGRLGYELSYAGELACAG